MSISISRPFGGTRAYYRFRDGVRAYYREHYPGCAAGGPGPLNPGSGWVSRLCFEPRVGLQVLEEMLAPHVDAGRLRILLNHTPLSADVRGGRIIGVTLGGPEESRVELRAAVYLDASELGDLLALSGAPYVTGAEAVEDTGEPHASTERGAAAARAELYLLLSGGITARVRTTPSASRTVTITTARRSPSAWCCARAGGGYKRFRMFEGETPFWTYRRVFDAAQLVPGAFARCERAPPRDIALINWDAQRLLQRKPDRPLPGPAGAHPARGAAAVAQLSVLAANRSAARQ